MCFGIKKILISISLRLVLAKKKNDFIGYT